MFGRALFPMRYFGQAIESTSDPQDFFNPKGKLAAISFMLVFLMRFD